MYFRNILAGYLFIILAISFPVHGQISKRDSLRKALIAHPKPDTVQAKILMELGVAYFPDPSDSAEYFFSKGVDLASRLNFPYVHARSLNGLGLKALGRGDVDLAKSYLLMGLEVTKKGKDTQMETKILNNLGYLFQNHGVLDSAVVYHLKGLILALKTGQRGLAAKLRSDLGMVQALKGNFQLSLSYYLKALHYYEEVQSLQDLVLSHSRLGNLFLKQRDFTNARREYLQALALNGDSKYPDLQVAVIQNLGLLYHQVKGELDTALTYLQLAASMARNLGLHEKDLITGINIGNVYLDQKNYAKALEYYSIAYADSSLKNRQYETTALEANLGSVYLKMDRLKEARIMLENGLENAKKGGFTEFQKNACISLSELERQSNNFQKAYHYMYEAHRLSEILFSDRLSENLTSMRYQHELEKADQANKILKKENELNDQIISRQKIGGIFWSVITILILAIALITSIARLRLRKLIRILDEQNQSLRNLMHTKDKFFSIVAHDLRSPFNGLIGLLTELDEGYEELDAETKKQAIHNLRKTSHNTYKLLENLLEWATSQKKGIVNQAEILEPFGMVEKTFDVLQTRATQKFIKLENLTDPMLRVFADPRLMESLLINLVTNAIKFTPTGGLVQVLGFLEPNQMVRISVSDTGVGIPENELPTLFNLDRIYKCRGTDGEPGTGLGLTMCAEYMAILGGTISVESEPGKGSTFSIILPGANPAGNGSSPASEAANG